VTHPTATSSISRALRLTAIVVACLLFTGSVRAHGYIIRAIPEDRAALDRAPARAQYWFSEDLEPAFSQLIVRDQTGTIVAEGGVSRDDLTLLAVRLPHSLPDGAYRSELRIAFAGDGHVIVATQSFFVGQAADESFGVSDDSGAVPFEIVWRALLLTGTMALFGAFILYNGVLLPAWGSRAHPAGGLPPRLMARLDVLIIAALGVAALANVLALLQQTSVFFGAPLDRVIAENLWNTVRVSTRFGDTWNWRMLLLGTITVIHAAGLYYRRAQPDLIRAGWAANVWACALLLGTWSVASHAPGSQVLPYLALISDWLHGLAVGAWAGGALVLTWVLPSALAPLSGEARRLALLAVLQRFSRLAIVGVAVVITTGVYNAANWFTTTTDAATPYGVALLVKLGLVAVLLAVGAAHQIALNPGRYARWGMWVDRVRGRVGSFAGTLRIESALTLIVLVAAAWLSATPPPTPEIVSPPPLTGTIQIAGRDVTLTIAPGGVGVNTYDVQVNADGVPVSNAAVRVRLSDPARDRRGAWLTADAIDDGLYSAADGEIDRIGGWWALLDVDGMSGALALDVRADAALLRSRPPSPVNAIALLGVVGAIGMALTPRARRVVRALDLSPAALTVAVGATIAALAVVVVGLALTSRGADEYTLASAPLPEIVNPVLPDGNSIARGAAVFTTTCAGWREARDFRELVERLPRLGDQDVYWALVRDGWRGLSVCADGLDDSARWDAVNFVRTFERPVLLTLPIAAPSGAG